MAFFEQQTSALVKPPEKTVIQGGFPGDTGYQDTLTIGMLTPLSGMVALRDASGSLHGAALRRGAPVGDPGYRGSAGHRPPSGTSLNPAAQDGNAWVSRSADCRHPPWPARFPEILPRGGAGAHLVRA